MGDMQNTETGFNELQVNYSSHNVSTIVYSK